VRDNTESIFASCNQAFALLFVIFGFSRNTGGLAERKVSIVRTTLLAYFVSIVILLTMFYVREPANAGPISGRTILIMTEIAAVFALLPASVYVLFAELIKSAR
jgi:hypothetical protein